MNEAIRLRLDKWLWAARFYKTRALAVDEIDKGRILVNGQAAKPAREVKVGDAIAQRQRDGTTRVVVVLALSDKRGPAPVAQALYEETAESLKNRLEAAQARRYLQDPATNVEHGRPTKRNRRVLDDVRHSWGERWSATLDDSPG